MSTKFQFESRLNDWLTLRNMPVQSFAEVVKSHGIAGAGQARLFTALRDGGKALPNEIVERLDPLKNEIEALCKAVAPFALDLTDAARVWEWLTASRNGDLRVIVNYNQSADSYVVAFAGGAFNGLPNGRPVPSETPMVVTLAVAETIADHLRSAGYDGIRIRKFDGSAEVVSDFNLAWK